MFKNCRLGFPCRLYPVRPASRGWRAWKRRVAWLITALLTTGFCSLGVPRIFDLNRIALGFAATATVAAAPAPEAHSPLAQTADGKTLYDAGRFADAARVLEQTATQLRQQNNPVALAATLANLALTYQQLGQIGGADRAIAESVSLLAATETPAAQQVRAQVFEIQGQLWFQRGNGNQALMAWQQAERVYRQLGNPDGVLRSQVNQAQSLRSQGFTRRALDLLTQVNQQLQTQPNSPQKVLALRSLGDTLQLVGDWPQAEARLQESLRIAQSLQPPMDLSPIWLSLGNVARGQTDKLPTAIAAYQQATALATQPLTRVQAQLNGLNLAIAQQDWATVSTLLPQISTGLTDLPPSRAAVYARINLAQALLRLSETSGSARPALAPGQISQLLQTTLKPAIEHARQLQDIRAESYALGTLGAVYEQTRQLDAALSTTQRALALAQASNTWDIAYRWQWQLGRLQKQAGKPDLAIAQYDAAIANLKALRGDLVAVNPDVQFNFRDSVAPVYREAVALLLNAQSGNPPAAQLEKARQYIEDLQLAELDNFFREACLEGRRVLVDDVVDQQNPTTSIIYPIVLRDRATQTVSLQIVAKLPGQPLKRYSVPPMPATEFDGTIQRLTTLVAAEFNAANRRDLQAAAQTVYTWLVQPLEADLQASTAETAIATKSLAATPAATPPKVDTLVFVLDDALRSVPMAMLWDGKQYLVEKYSLALSLGLQLLDPKPIAREPLKVLAAGLRTPPADSPINWVELPNVSVEINAIADLGIPTTPLLDQAFTRTALSNQINAAPFNVVHLATHGIFSSRAEETFILAADGPINVSQFDTLLRSRDITRSEAIQLLVLSACQTATNDDRATLGLAGFAIRAGARSTLASLRNVSDESTARLIQTFYQELTNPAQAITKAEALRRAQVDLLKSTNYQAPQYWASYVLIGNWL